MAETNLDQKGFKILLFANAIMILTIIVHDADHVRQAMGWSYRIGPTLWLINMLVYIPNGSALALTFLRRGSAAIATSAGSLLIAASFAETHLWRPSLQVWGIWNRSFFELGVDAISWSILAATIAVGVGSAIAGAYVAGALSERRGRPEA
jgi:hypothetical protein